MQWRECICRSSSPAKLANLDAFTKDIAESPESPIDSFHATMQQLMQTASPDFLEANPLLGPLFISGMVAATEEYVRSLLGRLISICPDAQAAAAEKSIHLGSAIWHGRGVVARGAFENVSLASSAAIEKTILHFIGYQITKKDRASAVLGEFDKVCEIRHAVVHSGVTMPGKNAVKLRLSPVQGNPGLHVGFSEIQDVAAVCIALAVSLNLDLFGAFAKRWATSWRSHQSWTAKSEHDHFKEIWSTFYSSYDRDRLLITSPLSMIKCRNAIKSDFS